MTGGGSRLFDERLFGVFCKGTGGGASAAVRTTDRGEDSQEANAFVVVVTEDASNEDPSKSTYANSSS
jgi:hypothetical protein